MSNEEKILQHLLKEFQERGESLSKTICDGAAKDYAEYRYLCGQIQGLMFAQITITDLVRKLESFDE
jgi:hypothetical protein